MKLESKFIEGTDEKYSIREDAVIIKNYYNKNTPIGLNKIISVHYNKVRFRIDNKWFILNLLNLMDEYFGFNYCIHCNQKYVRDGNSHVCKPCRRKNKLKIDVLNNKKHREEISKTYVAMKLNIMLREVTDELHELYKNNLQFKRQVSKENNISINKLR